MAIQSGCHDCDRLVLALTWCMSVVQSGLVTNCGASGRSWNPVFDFSRHNELLVPGRNQFLAASYTASLSYTSPLGFNEQ